MKNTLKKLTAVALSILLVLVLFAGCASSGGLLFVYGSGPVCRAGQRSRRTDRTLRVLWTGDWHERDERHHRHRYGHYAGYVCSGRQQWAE